jgi:dual specificity phosphatase 12
MDWVIPGVAIGAIEDALAHQRLREAGIRSILSLSDFPTLSGFGFAWRRVVLIDGHGNDPALILDAVAHLEELYEQEPAVLVHCAEGKSRSVLIVTLFLARSHGLEFEEAYDLVKVKRRQAAIDWALHELGSTMVAEGALAPTG